MPLAPLPILIGRNGNGTSHALDAREVLARLAQGDEIRELQQKVNLPSGQSVRLWTRDDSRERADAAWNG